MSIQSKTLELRYSDKTAYLEGHSIADIASLDTGEGVSLRVSRYRASETDSLPVITEVARPISIVRELPYIGRRQLTNAHCYVGASGSMTMNCDCAGLEYVPQAVATNDA